MKEGIPLDAIDPDAAYEEWQRRYQWHIDQIPRLIETTGILATPHLRAATYDQEKVTGGGYIDNVPIVDGAATRDATQLWTALRAYLASASSHVGLEAPQLPADLTAMELATARTWAYEAIAWLAAIMHLILAWPDLTELEDALFTIIRRAMHHNPAAGTVRRTRPEECDVCGNEAVLVDWIDAPDGTATLARACKVCGTIQHNPNQEPQP